LLYQIAGILLTNISKIIHNFLFHFFGKIFMNNQTEETV
jgi:hypothetical protein